MVEPILEHLLLLLGVGGEVGARIGATHLAPLQLDLALPLLHLQVKVLALLALLADLALPPVLRLQQRLQHTHLLLVLHLQTPHKQNRDI